LGVPRSTSCIWRSPMLCILSGDQACLLGWWLRVHAFSSSFATKPQAVSTQPNRWTCSGLWEQVMLRSRSIYPSCLGAVHLVFLVVAKVATVSVVNCCLLVHNGGHSRLRPPSLLYSSPLSEAGSWCSQKFCDHPHILALNSFLLT
jgi:hypothetical protein